MIVGLAVTPFILTQQAIDNANNAAQSNSVLTEIPAIVAKSTDVPTLAPTPTPAYAQVAMLFGESGIGPVC